MNQEILDYIDKHIDTIKLEDNDYFNALKNNGIFIAKNRKKYERKSRIKK